jgi:hypothetical protein
MAAELSFDSKRIARISNLITHAADVSGSLGREGATREQAVANRRLTNGPFEKATVAVHSDVRGAFLVSRLYRPAKPARIFAFDLMELQGRLGIPYQTAINGEAAQRVSLLTKVGDAAVLLFDQVLTVSKLQNMCDRIADATSSGRGPLALKQELDRLLSEPQYVESRIDVSPDSSEHPMSERIRAAVLTNRTVLAALTGTLK